MNKPEGETHTLDCLDNLEFLICGGLQGLAELLGQNGPNERPCEPGATRNYPREGIGLRGLFPRLRRRLIY